MKSVIVYYSYSGNTKKVAEVLAGYLKEKGEVELWGIKALDESGNFFAQSARALRKKRAEIAAMNYDLRGFDLICFGTPVWAFAPAPAMNTYLDICLDLENKGVVLFTTYGSGTGNERCLQFMQGLLAKKGVRDFKHFSVQQSKVKEKEFVLSKIKEIL